MKSFLFLLLFFIIISCDTTNKAECTDNCDYIGQLLCTDLTVKVCQKEDNGCLEYKFLQDCKTGETCVDNQCYFEEEDLCKDVICKNNEVCKGKSGVCVCVSGFHLLNNECIEDECTNEETEEEICNHGIKTRTCTDGVWEDYSICGCDTNWSGVECDECIEGFHLLNNECIENECENEETEDRSCNHGVETKTCIDGVWGDYSACECNLGYSGELCNECTEGFHLLNNECIEDDCTNEETEEEICNHGKKTRTCIDGVWGDYSTCECDDNWSGENCDIDDTNCSCPHGSCVNFICICEPDYISTNNNFYKLNAFQLDLETNIWKSQGYDTNEKKLNMNANIYNSCSYAEDWYKVNLELGETLNITIKFTHQDGNLDLYFYNDTLDTPIFTRKTFTDDEKMIITIRESGIHYIKVVGVNTNQNNYSMKVEKSCDYDSRLNLCIPNNCSVISSSNIKKYLYCEKRINWNSAKIFCENFNSYLATINDQIEDGFISSNTDSNIFIGLNDKNREAGNNRTSPYWIWVGSNSSTPSYRNWANQEPNDASNQATEDCVLKTRLGWADIPCISINHFLCEFN